MTIAARRGPGGLVETVMCLVLVAYVALVRCVVGPSENTT